MQSCQKSLHDLPVSLVSMGLLGPVPALANLSEERKVAAIGGDNIQCKLPMLETAPSTV